MRVTVRLFALAKQRAGRPHIEVDLAQGATVADLKMALAEQSPALASLVPSLIFAVNSEYADDARLIPEDAEVAAIPPVSGGGTFARLDRTRPDR